MPRPLPFLLLLAVALDAHAGTMCIGSPASIPTLDNIGLMGLAIAVGIAAGWAVRRKK